MTSGWTLPHVADAWRALLPLNDRLRRHVGPPRVERQRPGA